MVFLVSQPCTKRSPIPFPTDRDQPITASSLPCAQAVCKDSPVHLSLLSGTDPLKTNILHDPSRCKVKDSLIFFPAVNDSSLRRPDSTSMIRTHPTTSTATVSFPNSHTIQTDSDLTAIKPAHDHTQISGPRKSVVSFECPVRSLFGRLQQTLTRITARRHRKGYEYGQRG